MMDFDFYSNNWFDIELLYSEHLHAETLYVEQLTRWGLQHGHEWGVVQIGEDDLQVHGSNDGYEVALRACKAITRNGYLIEVNSARPPLTLQGSNSKHTDSLVPIYLGVAAEKESADAGASQTGALLDRPALRWRYKLATEADSTELDWIQIGRMRREGPRFVHDDKYIPRCVQLRSYPALRRMTSAIVRAAEQALTALEGVTARSDGQDISPAHLALAGVMITTIAPATVLIDGDARPRHYLERMVAILRAYASLLPLLQAVNSDWKHAHDKVQKALKGLLEPAPGDVHRSSAFGQSFSGDSATRNGYAASGDTEDTVSREMMRPGMYWWDGFEMIRDAFEALGKLFAGLAITPGPTGQAPPEGGGTTFRRPPQQGFQPVRKT